MYEYMTVDFKRTGTTEDTVPELEGELDERGRQGWRLHTINVMILNNREYWAVLIYEREVKN